MKFQLPKWLRRPKYLWMNYNQIKEVRDQLTKLFLDPGESIVTAPPKRCVKGGVELAYFGVNRVRVFGGNHPAFQWDLWDGRKVSRQTVWLKIMSDRNPWFDLQTETGEMKDKKISPHLVFDPEIEWDDRAEVFPNLRFNDPRTLMVADLVRAYSWHFPFVPTRNHLGAVNM